MAGTVQAQVDVGSLSLQGLGAFTSVLATLSADNVSPFAMIQLENLGAMFPTNGARAEKVKMLLQRCSDVRLNNLAHVIGWRKNDTTSLMANSAGGQAVSLLSLCLTNLFSREDTGVVFHRLCAAMSNSPTKKSDVASLSQLADAAGLLSGKLQTLGFGNFLAHETVKIYSVYTALGMTAPENLLRENLDVESVAYLLGLTSRALIEDNKICRVSGSRGMGYIVGLLLTLFPRTTMMTIEGTIIRNVENAAIKIEILSVPENAPTTIYLETIISETSPAKLPIEPVMSLATTTQNTLSYCRHRWSGWLADSLQTLFLNIGLECDQDILDACSEFLMLIPGRI